MPQTAPSWDWWWTGNLPEYIAGRIAPLLRHLKQLPCASGLDIDPYSGPPLKFRHNGVDELKGMGAVNHQLLIPCMVRASPMLRSCPRVRTSPMVRACPRVRACPMLRACCTILTCPMARSRRSPAACAAGRSRGHSYHCNICAPTLFHTHPIPHTAYCTNASTGCKPLGIEIQICLLPTSYILRFTGL